MNTAIILVLLLYITNFVNASLTNTVEGDDTFDALDTFEPAKFSSRSSSNNSDVSSISGIYDFTYEYDSEYDGDVSAPESSSTNSSQQETESDDTGIRTTENLPSRQKSSRLKAVGTGSSLESESNRDEWEGNRDESEGKSNESESNSNSNESGNDNKENESVESSTEPLAWSNQALSSNNDSNPIQKQQSTASNRYSLLQLVNSNLPKSPSKLKFKSERKNQLNPKRSPYENVFVWVGGLFAFCLLLSLVIYYLAYSGSDSDTLFEEEEKAYDHFSESNEIKDGYDDDED